MTSALLFDLYGVVMRVQSPVAIAEIEAAAGYGGPELWEPYWQFREPYDNGLIAAPDYWRQVAAASGREIADVDRVIAAEVAGWSQADDQMVDYVQQLAARHRVGVLSNLPIDVVHQLQHSQPWIFDLEVVVLSSWLHVAKPHPQAYRYAAEQFDLATGEILFIDDRPDNLAGARAVGMPGVLFTSLAELRPVIVEQLGE